MLRAKSCSSRQTLSVEGPILCCDKTEGWLRFSDSVSSLPNFYFKNQLGKVLIP